MKIDMIAKLKSSKDFMENYKVGDEKQSYEGKSLIFFSLSNSDLDSRYEISNLLLENNIDVLCRNEEQQTVLHVLLGQSQNDISKVAKLCAQFIDMGVDINARDKNGQMAIHYITRINKTDEDLKELYELWFSNSNLDLRTKDNAGHSALEYAEKFPYRANLIERINEYERRKSN